MKLHILSIMKKICTLLFASVLLFGITSTAMGQSKQMKKAMKKEYKEKIKKLTKEGWEVFGSTRTLEVALLKHYDALEQDGAYEIYGTAMSANKNIGKEKILMSAAASYAQRSGSSVRGRITDEMKSLLTPEDLQEFEDFYAAYENNVAATIKGELRSSLSLYRKKQLNGKEVYEFETYFIVDEVAASRARVRAFQNAMKESEIAQKHATQVSKFIEEGNPLEEE